MSIFVNVVGQKMTATSSTELIVEGSQNFVKIKFNLSSDWDNLSVFAQFIQSGVPYNKYLDEENSVFLPVEIVSGECKLLLYGTGDTTIGTTNYLTLKIQENLMIEDISSTDISKPLYNQLVDKFNELYNKSQEFSEEAKTSADVALSNANNAENSARRAEDAQAAAETAVEPLQKAIQDATSANEIAKKALDDLEAGNYATKLDIKTMMNEQKFELWNDITLGEDVNSVGFSTKDDGSDIQIKELFLYFCGKFDSDAAIALWYDNGARYQCWQAIKQNLNNDNAFWIYSKRICDGLYISIYPNEQIMANINTNGQLQGLYTANKNLKCDISYLNSTNYKKSAKSWKFGGGSTYPNFKMLSGSRILVWGVQDDD